MNQDEKKPAGLGEVVYSVDEKPKHGSPPKESKRGTDQEVEEADEESFPASDPPGFSGAVAKSDERPKGNAT